MLEITMRRARERIGEQQGRLHGWRPIIVGDVAVIAVQVLGMARGGAPAIGMNVVVAGRSAGAIERHGQDAAEIALRKRAILAASDRLEIVREGELNSGDGEDINPLRWPWQTLVVHVPERQLPAIAGLVSDTVPIGDAESASIHE